MNDGKTTGFLNRLKGLRHRWRDIASVLSVPARLTGGSDSAQNDTDRLRQQMHDCLFERGGEVSARARAAALGRTYLGLDEAGQKQFLTLLARDFACDESKIDAAVAGWQAASSAEDPKIRLAAKRALRASLESPRQKLLTQFNSLPEGVKFLVDLRAALLGWSKEEPLLDGLEGELKELLAAWFDVDFLELQQITWRSPAVVLEKIMAYEAVHTIKDWNDLKNRLDSDRRLYAFFHPRMPDEPLIFVEVALVSGISNNVTELLDQSAPLGDPEQADTAIFYSINNAQKGLVGISFGNFLIKRVVDRLSHELPNLKTFATLSPIPGFRNWLDKQLADDTAVLLTPSEVQVIQALAPEAGGGKLALAQALDTDWHEDDALIRALKAPLLRLCARYLSQRVNGKRALDPVAHFHLSNGARMERLNWLADRSEKGLNQSAGIMINYLYKLSEIEANHEAYRGESKIVQSSQVKAFLKD